MEERIMYVELKTGYSDNGPAWIGKVKFSKSGQTIYFNDKGFKKVSTAKTTGISGNFIDIETGKNIGFPVLRKMVKTGIGLVQGKYKLIEKS